MTNAEIAMDFVNEIESTFKQNNRNSRGIHQYTCACVHIQTRSLKHVIPEVSETVKQPKLFKRNETKIKVKLISIVVAVANVHFDLVVQLEMEKKNGIHTIFAKFLLFISIICFSFHSFLSFDVFFTGFSAISMIMFKSLAHNRVAHRTTIKKLKLNRNITELQIKASKNRPFATSVIWRFLR